MTLTTRGMLVLMFTLLLASSMPAQETATTTEPTTSTGAEERRELAPTRETQTSRETRNQFSNLMNEHPPELGTILALDPTLLSNEAFLAGYPTLQQFVAAHPEVRRNPGYFLENFQSNHSQSLLKEILGRLFGFGIFVFIAFIVTWFVRTIIEQKRWNRLSRTQTEVHGKILDRFGSSAELLEYMKTPAGTKFLESAPIPLHEAQVTQNAPVSRVLWSIQLGIVVSAGAIGMLLVSGHFDKETADGLFATGVIALSVGAGFVASAIVSLLVSRRLGLWKGPDAPELTDAGTVR